MVARVFYKEKICILSHQTVIDLFVTNFYTHAALENSSGKKEELYCGRALVTQYCLPCDNKYPRSTSFPQHTKRAGI